MAMPAPASISSIASAWATASAGVGVERLHQRPCAARRDAGGDEGAGVAGRQQPRLDADAPLGEQLAEWDDVGLALVHRARSGSSVQAATRASRRAGSGSMAAEVLSEISTPGQASRTARREAAQGAAASAWRPASS
jgi:hypothetical protein